MAEIYTETDPFYVDSLIIILYGDWGVGKTSIACTAKNPVTLDFDEGVHRSAFRKKAIRFSGWDELNTLDKLKKFVGDHNTVIIDVVDAMLGKIINHIENSKTKGSKDKRLVYGKLKEEFTRFLQNVRSLKKDIILVCHTEEYTDNNDVRSRRPKITGGSYDLLMQAADFVGYVYKSATQVVLDFDPKDYAVGKNSAHFPAMDIPRWEEGTPVSFMADLIKQMKDSINANTHAVREKAKIVAELNQQIGNSQTAQELNSILDKAKEFSPALKRSLWASLEARAKMLDIKFDKVDKLFMATPMDTETSNDPPPKIEEPISEPPSDSARRLSEDEMNDWFNDYDRAAGAGHNNSTTPGQS